jgi:hypothetical protein
LFTAKPGVAFTLKNSAGDIVPVDWSDEYLSNDVETETGTTMRVGLVPKPADGTYRLTATQVSGVSNELQFYLYASDGLVTKQTNQLTAPISQFEIRYVKDPSGVRAVAEIDLIAPPIPTHLTPTTGSYVRPNGLVLNWDDVTDPSMPVTYNYKSAWKNGTYGPVSTGTNSSIDASGTPDEVYSWQVQACDSVGNCSDWSLPTTLTVDSTSPIAPTILRPTENEYLRTSPITNIWSSASDTSPIEYYRVEYKYSDGHTFPNFPYRTTTALQRDHSPALSEQGGVSYRVQAFDRAGNEGIWSDWRYYVYDATIPTIPGEPESQVLTNSPSQQWIWQASTDLGGAGLLGYYNRTHSVETSTTSDWSWLGNVLTVTTNLSEGVWNMDLKAVDTAGNESAAVRSEDVTVDLTAPGIPLLLSPIDGAIVNGATLLSDWSA